MKTLLIFAMCCVYQGSAMMLKVADGLSLEEGVKARVNSPDVRDLDKRQAVSTCTNGYESVPDSTMCLTDSPKYISGSAGVSAANKALILEMHNLYRAGVSSPSATTMQKMYWDDELARTAEKWAKQCYLGHEENLGKSRYIPAYGEKPGQNGAFGYLSWEEAVAGWHSEVELFQFGVDPNLYLAEGEAVGHYTQIVHDKSILVGCGYAKCSDGLAHYYFCNYLAGQTTYKTPYSTGPSCSGCGGKCVNNKLCDCQGKYCFNDGTLDPTTCSCSCPSPFVGDKCLTRLCLGTTCQNGGTLNTATCACSCTPLYAGDFCQTTSCPAQDPGHCGTQWPPEFCDMFTNVPDDCPHMCNKC